MTTARQLIEHLEARPDELVELDNLPDRDVIVFRSRKRKILQAVRRGANDIYAWSYEPATTFGDVRALIREAHRMLHVDEVLHAVAALLAAQGFELWVKGPGEASGIRWPVSRVGGPVGVARAHRALHAASEPELWSGVPKGHARRVPYPAHPNPHGPGG